MEETKGKERDSGQARSKAHRKVIVVYEKNADGPAAPMAPCHDWGTEQPSAYLSYPIGVVKSQRQNIPTRFSTCGA